MIGWQVFPDAGRVKRAAWWVATTIAAVWIAHALVVCAGDPRTLSGHSRLSEWILGAAVGAVVLGGLLAQRTCRRSSVLATVAAAVVVALLPLFPFAFAQGVAELGRPWHETAAPGGPWMLFGIALGLPVGAVALRLRETFRPGRRIAAATIPIVALAWTVLEWPAALRFVQEALHGPPPEGFERMTWRMDAGDTREEIAMLVMIAWIAFALLGLARTVWLRSVRTAAPRSIGAAPEA